MRASNLKFNYSRTSASNGLLKPLPPHPISGASASVSSKVMIMLSLIHSSHCVWGVSVRSLISGVVLVVLSSFAILSLRKRERVGPKLKCPLFPFTRPTLKKAPTSNILFQFLVEIFF